MLEVFGRKKEVHLLRFISVEKSWKACQYYDTPGHKDKIKEFYCAFVFPNKAYEGVKSKWYKKSISKYYLFFFNLTLSHRKHHQTSYCCFQQPDAADLEDGQKIQSKKKHS